MSAYHRRGFMSHGSSKSTPEHLLTNEIFHWFEVQRFMRPWRCFVFRVKTMGVFDQKKGIYRKDYSRWTKRGTSDLIGSWTTLYNRETRPLAIEIKSKNGTVSLEQKRFISDALQSGWIAFVAWNLEDVKNELAAADEGRAYCFKKESFENFESCPSTQSNE
jgi:hypothetical protein